MTHHEPTKEELYDRAQELDIEGRSTMTKPQLKRAIREAEAIRESAPSPTPDVVTPPDVPISDLFLEEHKTDVVSKASVPVREATRRAPKQR